jgi:hypothetical protein
LRPCTADSAFSDIAESGGNSRAGRAAGRNEVGASGRSSREDDSDGTSDSSGHEARDALADVLSRAKDVLRQSLPSLLGFALAWLSLSLLSASRGRAPNRDWDDDEEEWEDGESESDDEQAAALPPSDAPAVRSRTR